MREFLTGVKVVLITVSLLALLVVGWIMYNGLTGKEFPLLPHIVNEKYDKDYKIKEKKRLEEIDKKLEEQWGGNKNKESSE